MSINIYNIPIIVTETITEDLNTFVFHYLMNIMNIIGEGK